MLMDALNDAELLPANGIRYQSLREFGDGDTSALGFGWAVVEPRGRTTGHSHPEPEYYIVVQGIGLMKIAGDSAPIRARQAVFIPSGAHHQITNTGSDELVYVAVYWHPELENVEL
jgi:mannose-6-phosphate isomerase-like protein (cupin superfamily)